MATKESWNLDAGAQIADGRSVLETLGGGPRYEVMLVSDERLQRTAVAKILRPDRLHDERALRALLREADFLERLAHPVLVRSFGVVVDGPYPHILLEHVDGDNLRDILEDEATLAASEAVSVALALLSALHELAVNGIVHLDVKPSNVVLADTTRLIDFGAARTLAELASRRTPIGTPAYMAPEQCQPGSGLGPIGPPADVWGLGATLYHALTGSRPFSPPGPRGSDAVVRYPQLVERPAPIPDYVPAPVGRVLLAMLDYRAGDRPTALEAAAALEPLAADLADK